MQLQHADKLKYIKVIMIIINLIAVLFVPGLLYITTQNIYDHFMARDFLQNVEAIPDDPFINRAGILAGSTVGSCKRSS